MYVRKVVYKDPFQYANGSTFDSSSSANLKGSSANNWTITNNGTALAYVTSPAAGTQMYLTNYTSATVPSHVVFDFHVKASTLVYGTNGTEGMGLVFCANGSAGTFTTAYRMRQTQGYIYVEELAGGTWSSKGSIASNGTSNQDYYYRIMFFRTDFSVQGLTFGPEAGDIYIYKGTSYDKLDYVYKFTDSSGLLSGGWFGLYKGSGSTILSRGMGMFNFWNMDIDYVDVKHKLDEDSQATFALSRNPDRLNAYYTVGQRVEIWVPDLDADTGEDYLRLFFDGEVEVNPNLTKKDYYQALGQTKELSRLHWVNGTTANGPATDYLSSKLSGFPRQSGVNGSASVATALHHHGLKVSVTETHRDIQGTSMDLTFRKLCSELGYSRFQLPDGRFIISDTLIDPGITINGTSPYSRLLEHEIYYDGRQIVNVVNGYHSGWSSTTSASNGTNLSVYGARGATVVDMNITNSLNSGYINSNLIENYANNPAIVKLPFACQNLNVFPGMKIGLKLPGSPIGTNLYDADLNNWVEEYMTCTEHHFDSRTGINTIVLVYNDQDSPDTPRTRDLPVGVMTTPDRTRAYLSGQDT